MSNAVRGRKKTGLKPVPKGKMTHMHVRRMDNGGFTVDSDHELPEKKSMTSKKAMGSAMGFGPSTESHSASFTGPDDALAHVGQLMASGPPSPEAPPAPAGGAPAPGATDSTMPEGE
jgi:hypothetical protein